MLQLTLRTGIAMVHAANLMDTPCRAPGPLLDWLDVVAAPVGSTLAQGAAPLHQGGEWPSVSENPAVREWEVTIPGSWKQLAPGKVGAVVQASGRLVGGCLETVAMLPGSPFGDMDAFARSYAPEGLIVYLEVAESNALTAARLLHHVRLAGWFDHANAVLIGRTGAPESRSYSQLDALRSALGDLDVPVLYDVDFGHLPPQLSIVNGALATLELDGTNGRLAQQLI
jgi:muramoyltetrapeptide carboxypeptidase LdcA involved in peptidoglycan recycling